MALARSRIGPDGMNDPFKPFDPLDPEHRVQQRRERMAFFRQTDIFLVVVVTMVLFVPIAIWQKPWALPFLGWMAFMPHLLGGIDRAAAKLLDRNLVLGGNTLIAAALCAASFLLLASLVPMIVVAIVVGIALTLYLLSVVTGLIWGED